MKKLMLLMKTLLLFPVRLFSKVSPLALIKNSMIHKSSAVGAGCRIYDSQINRLSYIGKNSIVCFAEIGSFCSIAYNCVINPGNHPTNLISTSPVFYAKNVLRSTFNHMDFDEYKKVTIGNDVWIGTGAIIMGGVTIGDGAIIGAHSVVTRDVEPYSIVVGNPAREIRKRFGDEEIKKLLAVKWWDWDDEKIKKQSHYFLTPDLFFSESMKSDDEVFSSVKDAL